MEAEFGGYRFTDFSLPLVFDGRYFVVERGDPSLVTVFRSENGEPNFEIVKNAALELGSVDITIESSGRLVITEESAGDILYDVRPGVETIVTFRKADGGKCPAVITETTVQIGGLVVDNRLFDGALGGVVVDPEIGAGMLGAPLPPEVIEWLS